MPTLLRFALALVLLVPPSIAQHGEVRATSARFAVAITDGIATVELSLAVRNDTDAAGEADWILPLPDGAVADGFTTRLGDAPAVDGEVLDAARARTVYESIVRKRRDPGLLEHAGRGCLRARLFPLPPRGGATIAIRWRQVLEERGGLVRWSQPLRTAGLDGRPPEQVAFTAVVRASQAIRTALSPTPRADVRLAGDHEVIASFETAAGEPLPPELALYYGFADEAFGMHVLAQRAGEQDGWFALLISPKRSWDDVEVPPRAVTFVLDVSGSMHGAKLAQAKGALQRFLRGLRPSDRFDIVPFSTGAEPFFGKTVEASAANVDQALVRAAALEARGGTNLEAALRAGLPDRGPDGQCVPLCVLLSDGLPTLGETGLEPLRALARTLVAQRGARVFALGVGHDVHTVLLDDIAELGRGTRQYVRPDEDIEDKASDLLAKIGKPVMTDLRVTIDGAGMTRLAPSPLPDLFAGSQLVVTGRYATPGRHVVRLRGNVGGAERAYEREVVFPEREGAHDFVPKLWATRCIAGLLDEMRRHGPQQELLDEVRRVGAEFQIVTPYTSHLVVEDALGVGLEHQAGVRGPGDRVTPPACGSPGPSGPATPGAGMPGADARLFGAGVGNPAALPELAARLQQAGLLPHDAAPAELEALAREVAQEMQRSASDLTALGQSVSGARAVDDSMLLARARDVTTTGSAEFFFGGGSRAARSGSSAALLSRFVRRAGDKVFVRRGGVWTDRGFDPGRTYATKRTVEAFGDDYFALLREQPELARYVALGDRIRVVLGDLLVEITPPPGEGPARSP